MCVPRVATNTEILLISSMSDNKVCFPKFSHTV